MTTPRQAAAREPTGDMLIAARDWSARYIGSPIGNKAAIGCWQAMFDALPLSAEKGAYDWQKKAASRKPIE